MIGVATNVLTGVDDMSVLSVILVTGCSCSLDTGVLVVAATTTSSSSSSSSPLSACITSSLSSPTVVGIGVSLSTVLLDANCSCFLLRSGIVKGEGVSELLPSSS